MKRALSYLLLLAYSTVMLMPVLPYVSDSLAHTFWLYQHIATVHYEHGKYHTHYEALAIAKQTNSEKGAPNAKLTNSADDHYAASTHYYCYYSIASKQLFYTYNIIAVANPLCCDYPPPEV